MVWTNEKQPFGPNHAPLLTGLSSAGDGLPVPVAVDEATGRLLGNVTGSVTAVPVGNTRDTANEQTSPLSANTNTTIASGSNNVALPTGTINVASTTGFPTSGTINVWIAATTGSNIGQLVPHTITYTNTTGTSFTGCTGGTGTLLTGQQVTIATAAASPAGAVFTGSFTKIDTYPSVQILYAALEPFTASIIWSNDGVNPLGGNLGTSAVTIEYVNGYYVAYQVYSGDITAPYYELQVVNGATAQSAFPNFIAINWLNNSPYNGVFNFLGSQLNNISKALLTQAVIAGVDQSGNFSNVGISKRSDGTNALEVDNAGPEKTIFGSGFVENIADSISVNFSTSIPANLVNTSTANGGTVTQSAAQMVLQTSTATNGQAIATSRPKLIYLPGHEARVDFTATFTTGVTGATQYIGVFDDNNGFYLGYNGTDFVVARRNSGVDTQVTQANWNGNLTTEFTRDGVAEAIDFTKGNVYRIRFGWLGNAVINFEVLSPDGNYALINQIKFPNSSTTASIQNPNQSIRAEVTKTSGATNITLKSSSWRGGVMGGQVGSLTSISNFSNTALNAGDTFTGSGFDNILAYQGVAIVIATDQVSGSDGILLQFSDDGSTVRETFKRTFSAADVANGSKFIAVPAVLPFFRIVYTNGGVNQSSFFLQTTYNTGPLQQSIDNIESTISAASSATMVRNVAAAKNLSGQYNNITATAIDGSGRTGLHVGIMKFDVAAPILALTSWTTGQATIASTTTPVNVIPSPTSGRKTFIVKALSSNSKVVFVGPTSGVTSGNGFELAAGESIALEVDTTTGVWVIGTTATPQVLSYIEIVGT